MPVRSTIRLLIVRLGAMGDILHGLPAVTALRQMHPSWEIDWLIEPRWQALLRAESRPEPETGVDAQSQPIVDQIHTASTKQWRKRERWRETLGEIGSLRSELKDSEYDVVVDLQGGLRSAILGRMATSRRLIGSATPREKGADWLYNDCVATHSAHVIDQAVELIASIAGDELQAVAPALPRDSAAEAWAEELFSNLKGPAVLLNPGAGWGAKRWPIERYAAVAEDLCRRGCEILINTGPGEEKLAQTIRQNCGENARALNCSLGQLIAVTRRISLAIAGDTGPLHLACALQKPVVAIFGPTDPARNGPYGSPFRVLRSPISKKDHRRLSETEAGLLTIAPEAVLHAATDLLYPETVSEES